MLGRSSSKMSCRFGGEWVWGAVDDELEGGSWDKGASWEGGWAAGVEEKMERQLDALVRNPENFSERPSYSTPDQPPEESVLRENCSSMLLRHSRMSYPNSRESTRNVAVFAVPAGPVRTRMR